MRGAVLLAPDIASLLPSISLGQAVTRPTVNPGCAHFGQGRRLILEANGRRPGAAFVLLVLWSVERKGVGEATGGVGGGSRTEALVGEWPLLCAG